MSATSLLSGSPVEPSSSLTAVADTDLSDIPDDRDPQAEGDTVAPEQPQVEESVRKGKKRRRKKKRKDLKASERRTSTADREPPAWRSEDHKMNDIRSLKEREPEAFSIYATSEPDDGEKHDRDAGPDATKSLSGDESASANDGDVETNGHFTDTPNGLPSGLHGDGQENGDANSSSAESVADKSTPVPAPKINSEGRFPCPFAEAYGCGKTFTKGRAAIRHADVHTSKFVCSVCHKQLSRRDTFERHMTKHTTLEIASAEAVARAAPMPEQRADEPADGAAPVEDLSERTDNRSHQQFTTPPERLQVGSHAEQEAQARPELPQEDEDPEKDSEIDDAPDALSARHSPSLPSVMDKTNGPIENVTGAPRRGLKRKDTAEGTESTELPPKRRKKYPNSPPSSVHSRGETSDSALAGVTNGIRDRQATERIVPSLQNNRQSTIDGWAQKSTPSSQLKKPSSNSNPGTGPSLRKVEVVIPRPSQAGPSSSRATKDGSGAMVSNIERSSEKRPANGFDSSALEKARKAAYTTPKGKRKAESGVTYLSPPNRTQETGEEVDNSDSEPANIATSVAKRTFRTAQVRRKTGAPAADSGSESASEDGGEAEAEGLNDEVRTGKSEIQKLVRNGEGKPKQQLKKPRKNTQSVIRRLAVDDEDPGHGSGDGPHGRTGPFSKEEVRRLELWRDTFCDDYGLSNLQFNYMVTDTLKRGRKASWDWPFISKHDFLQQYVKVLPGRNKRSMLRYRERNFQNLEGSRNWTPEDDQELIRLQKELGSKWSDIAERLTRTVDAVSQRWRHKLRHGEIGQGEWEPAEITKFGKVLDKVRRESGPVASSPDWRVPWSQVSAKMGTRSAQQCSNHYRAIHGVKQGGKWIKVEGLEKTPGSSRILAPSKMELRLKGDAPGTSPREHLSQRYVVDDDKPAEDEADELDEGDTPDKGDDENMEDEESSSEDQPVPDEKHARSSLSAKKAAPSMPNPLTKRTPGKTLPPSQLFAQTQANTSSPRRWPASARNLESSDRPSPNIPIQRRRSDSRSPLQEIKLMQNGDLDVAQGAADDEDEEASGDEQSEDSEADESTSESDSEVDTEQPPDAIDDEAQEESDSDEDSDDSSAEDAAMTSDEDDDNETQVHQEAPGNDFMDSIEESAQRMRSGKLQPRGWGLQRLSRSDRRRVGQASLGNDKSGSGSDSESEG